LTLTPRWNFARTIAYRSDSGAFRAGRDQIHFGENLKFTPSALNLNFFGSQNWVDPLVGGRIQLALTEKIAITALGDVGGWGVGSQLEYQAGGLLGYRIKPNWTLQAGYRYINFDYRANRTRTFVVNTTMSGVVVGLTYAFD
jgi:opacity protein-like surface antigen